MNFIFYFFFEMKYFEVVNFNNFVFKRGVLIIWYFILLVSLMNCRVVLLYIFLFLRVLVFISVVFVVYNGFLSVNKNNMIIRF